MQLGDWLDPDAPPERPWLAKADPELIANAFFAHSARLLARTASIVGDETTATWAAALGDRVAAATWQAWRDTGPGTQTGCALLICMDIAPASERPAVGQALADLVNAADGRVATGFLGTPFVLPALARTGHLAEAYRMLLRTGTPSWLYQVEHGATTIWERWDAIRPDGSIHPGTLHPVPGSPDGTPDGHMLSFNHYAYGAVIDWVYRHVAGLAPDSRQPGYRLTRFAPAPVHGMTWARARVASAYGDVSIAWEIDDTGLFSARVGLPNGTSGEFLPPASAASEVTLDGVRSPGPAPFSIGAGEHLITVSSPILLRVPGGQDPDATSPVPGEPIS